MTLRPALGYREGQVRREEEKREGGNEGKEEKEREERRGALHSGLWFAGLLRKGLPMQPRLAWSW